MKKIPTLFMRNHHSDNLVRAEIPCGCEWVYAGQGIATIKWDGTCCMIKDGIMYKRYDAKRGKTPPDGFVPAEPEPDPVTQHWPGWVLVDQSNKADKYHVEAMDEYIRHYQYTPPDGTYELCGPKINGNPEGITNHVLIPHGEHVLTLPPGQCITVQDFYVMIARYLAGHNIEGIVWYNSDGRMCKIKRRDFGLSWPKREEQNEIQTTQPIRDGLDREAEQTQDSNGSNEASAA